MGTPRDSRLLVAFGVACLVVSSLCDSVRAPALPLLARDYAAGYGALSSFLTAGSLGSLAFNMLAMRALGGMSDRGVVALAAVLQAAAMLSAAAAPNLTVLAAAGFVWGAGNVGLGLCANLLVIRGSAPEDRARRLSLLHVFYGLSCVLPPLYVASADAAGWRTAALLAAPAVLPVLLVLGAVGLPAGRAPEPAGAGPSDGLPWLLGSVIALYVLGEVMTSMWVVALLTEQGTALAEAGRVLSGFFLALAATRAASAAWVGPGHDRVLVPLGLSAGIAGTLLGAAGHRAGFWLAGAAFGPVFPLLMARLSALRPRGLREALAFVYAAMVVALGLGHLVVGWLAQAVSPRAAGYFAPACLAAGLAAWLLVPKSGGRGGKPSAPLAAGAA